MRKVAYAIIICIPFCFPLDGVSFPNNLDGIAESTEKDPLQPLSETSEKNLPSSMPDSAMTDSTLCFGRVPFERLQNILRRVVSYFTELANTFYGFYGLNR